MLPKTPVFDIGLIGYPLGHTMSPCIHTMLMSLKGVRGKYTCFEIPPAELTSCGETLRSLNGFNITIPHKQAIIPMLDALDERAAFYHSVNTVLCTEQATGYNTDYLGFLRALETADIPLAGDVLLCGCGGVARTMAFESLFKGCRLTIAVRENGMDKAKAFKQDILSKLPGSEITLTLYSELNRQYDLMLNATPVGMYPHEDGCILTKKQIENCARVFDSIYNPAETKLLKAARANGSDCIGGMPMLVWQAAAAEEIWFNVSFTEEEIAQTIEHAQREMERMFR